MAKGVIARFEQFLFLSQCFQELSAAEVSVCWKGLIIHSSEADDFRKYFGTRKNYLKQGE